MKNIKVITQVSGQNPEIKETTVSGEQTVAEVMETVGHHRIGLGSWNITVDGKPASADTAVTEKSSYINLQYKRIGN